jgi:hypothetical protein
MFKRPKVIFSTLCAAVFPQLAERGKHSDDQSRDPGGLFFGESIAVAIHWDSHYALMVSLPRHAFGLHL